MAVPVGGIVWRCAHKRVYERFLSTPFSSMTMRFNGNPSTSNASPADPIGGIGIKRHALVHHFYRRSECRRRPSKMRYALRRPRGVPRAETAERDRSPLRFEHSRLGCASIGCGLRLDSACARLRGRSPRDRSSPNRASRLAPSRCRCRRRPCRHRQVGVGRPVKCKQPVAGRNRDGIGVPIEKSCEKIWPSPVLSMTRRTTRRGRRVEVRGVFEVCVHGRVGLRPELRHQLGIVRRQPCQLSGKIDRAFQTRVVEHIG